MSKLIIVASLGHNLPFSCSQAHNDFSLGCPVPVTESEASLEWTGLISPPEPVWDFSNITHTQKVFTLSRRSPVNCIPRRTSVCRKQRKQAWRFSARGLQTFSLPLETTARGLCSTDNLAVHRDHSEMGGPGWQGCLGAWPVLSPGRAQWRRLYGHWSDRPKEPFLFFLQNPEPFSCSEQDSKLLPLYEGSPEF